MMIEMVKGSPQTLMSLGDKSDLLMHSVMNECDDLRLAKRMLDLYGSHEFTPLLPYGPKVSDLRPIPAQPGHWMGGPAVLDAAPFSNCRGSSH